MTDQVTDQQRRDVAAAIRQCGGRGDWLDLVLREVAVLLEGEQAGDAEAWEQLAALVDRPTCGAKAAGRDCTRLTCGHDVRYRIGEFRYCPMCGREVI